MSDKNKFECKIVGINVTRGKVRVGKNPTGPMIDAVVTVRVIKQKGKGITAEFSIKNPLSFNASFNAVSFDESREERFRDAYLREDAPLLEVEEKGPGSYRFTATSINDIRVVIGTGTPARKSFAVTEGAAKSRGPKSVVHRDRATYAEA